MSDEMTGAQAQLQIDRLGRARHDLLVQITELDERHQELAYDFLVDGRVLAEQELFKLERKRERLDYSIAMHDHALAALRRYAQGRDAREVMNELFGANK